MKLVMVYKIIILNLEVEYENKVRIHGNIKDQQSIRQSDSCILKRHELNTYDINFGKILLTQYKKPLWQSAITSSVSLPSAYAFI